MNCEYCEKVFVNLSSLNNHKKTAKYCLKIQKEKGIINYDDEKKYQTKKYKCNICSKEFITKNNLKYHLENLCMKDIYKDIFKTNDMILEKSQIIIKLDTVIKEKDIFIEKLKNKISTLEEINNIYKSDHTCIQEIAKQPKNITTNNNNNNNKILNVITPFNITDKEQIVDIVKNNYNINYIFSGQKGCARFVYENIIKDTEGNLKYICSDPSRFIYKYKDEYGNIQKDIDARRLTNLLIEGGLKNKACNMASEWWTDENGEVNTDKFEMLIEKAEAIRTMEQDNTEFKKELATMTSV